MSVKNFSFFLFKKNVGLLARKVHWRVVLDIFLKIKNLKIQALTHKSLAGEREK